MKREGLILIGGGGHCRSVLEACASSGIEVAGILDRSERIGETVCGVKIIGEDSSMTGFVKDHPFLVTVGSIKSSAVRRRLYEELKRSGGELATVIASSANVSRFAAVEEGTVVLHGAFVNAGARIGKNCILNTGCIIEHDVSVGNHTHVSTGAVVNGNVEIGEACFIGSGAVVIQGLKIASETIVGAGAVVVNDIIESGIYAGVPARKIGNI